MLQLAVLFLYNSCVVTLSYYLNCWEYRNLARPCGDYQDLAWTSTEEWLTWWPLRSLIVGGRVVETPSRNTLQVKGLMEHETLAVSRRKRCCQSRCSPLYWTVPTVPGTTTRCMPVTVENAVLPHHHGRYYFEIRRLRRRTQSYWKKPMTVDQTWS